MYPKSLLFSLFISCFLSLTAWSQKDLTNGSVEEQLEYVESSSNNYQQFKVIEKTKYTTLKNQVVDSVKKLEAQIEDIESQLALTKANAKDYTVKLTATQDSLTETRALQQRMRWIGIPMEKPMYRFIMWGIIGILLAILLITLVRFRVNNGKTKEAKTDLEKLQEEFEQHRKAALLREQKLRRELQDEINLRRKREGGAS
jgi:preprotein translocase subunit SecF